MVLRKAKINDLPKVLSLYKSVIGTEGCTWNDYYPGEEELNNDFETDSLYVLEDDCGIIGAISVVPENELDGMDCWHIHDGTQREIARVVISPNHQGSGYGKQMLTQLFSELKGSGCHAVHILVAQKNLSAIGLYKGLGFNFIGKAFMYGIHFYICEKILI